MRWRDEFRTEVSDAIARFGFDGCKICNYGQPDDDTNVEMYVRLECSMCGYAMFFNAERYRTGDEPIITMGS